MAAPPMASIALKTELPIVDSSRIVTVTLHEC